MRKQQRPADENRYERAEVVRLIAERHREDAEESRNIAHEAERSGATTLQLEGWIRSLEERLTAMESLLRTLIAEQHRSTANERILQMNATIARAQDMARDAKKMRQNGQRMRGKRDE